MSNQQRIDKWLWATRIFKTRSIAAEACKKGRVSIEGRTLKPSSMVTVGDTIQVRKPPITLTYQILALCNNRIGAKLTPEYLKNVTPSSEYDLLELHRLSGQAGRKKGTGRPTKKERRDLDQFIEAETSQVGDQGWLDDFDDFDEGEDWMVFWDED